ncbi:NERD domain-containing protein [Virgibacillus sp. NKC19-16]|uniref:nuclease-related domain-containing protein n=1 Tax=Virgibacillus salidurans TaxID=2831673 RepID=UPI001F29EC42|nr:nuclease-related domain-containing protein [Virgibacillus sp. NKC19-16]UJL45998.1 NERD domain-containing protein [Virgibacillus sp. NKC19-16]
MIVKKYEKSLELWQLEALDRRLIPMHPEKGSVQKSLKNKRTGVKGEKEIAYPLRFLDEQKYFILHNLRIADEQGYFQIDTLILSTTYILILEVKNWYGTVIFGENGQVTRIGDENNEEGFDNPIPQAKLQRHRLQRWLRLQYDIEIPINFFVVISFPSTIIKSTTSQNLIPKEVIHKNDLYFKIEALSKKSAVTYMEKEPLMNLAKRLVAAHKPKDKSILDRFRITKNELMKGVFCPKCGAVPMVRDKRKWLCCTCKYGSIKAHMPTLIDYKLLIGDRISNGDAREFLQVESPYVVKGLLKKEDFIRIGEKSTRLYELKFNSNWNN